MIKNKVFGDIIGDLIFEDRHLTLLTLVLTTAITNPEKKLADPLERVGDITKLNLEERDKVYTKAYQMCKKGLNS